ncbi:MAG TPA: hypothetical protein VJT49_32585 [Amycolatopsis sp.]|uniref:hypothetical protein n=1 Tax=Amycolatopsis sp. TaxID=37632 RepID=UPI002B4883FE|nr:hypothetical protein [Amycolatopsis sp.]HKS49761.1 hypothetical protein [Amycolatopsis sp.]
MKGGGRIALGVGIGYLLGRTRKMRLALSIAAAGATRAISPRDLLQRGLKQLGGAGELGKLTDTARGELLNAAKAAAATAASSRIDALNDRLQAGGGLKPGEGKKPPEEAESGRAEAGEEEEPQEKEESREKASGEQEEPEAEATRGEADEEEQPEKTEEPRGPATHRRTPARTAARRRSPEESDEESPTRRTAARARAGAARMPVRRTRR